MFQEELPNDVGRGPETRLLAQGSTRALCS